MNNQVIDLQLLEKHIKNYPDKQFRRTVSFNVQNHCYIQVYRGSMLKLGKDFTYTFIVNELLNEAIQTRLTRIKKVQQSIDDVSKD